MAWRAALRSYSLHLSVLLVELLLLQTTFTCCCVDSCHFVDTGRLTLGRQIWMTFPWKDPEFFFPQRQIGLKGSLMPGCVQTTLQMMSPIQPYSLATQAVIFLLLCCLVMGQYSAVCQIQIQGVLVLMCLVSARCQQTGKQHDDVALDRPNCSCRLLSSTTHCHGHKN